MKNPIHILHLEDDPKDAALVQAMVESAGIACAMTCVQNQDDFLAALELGETDIVLSECSISGFDGLAAIAAVRSRWADLPIILVSESMGEERAVDSLKQGATDCVLKASLSRLVPAVERAMLEAGERSERKRLKAQLMEAQKMEVIGQLAGGVAHDFNNILAVIVGYSSLISSKLESESPLHKYTDEIWHASERASKLTRQLLVFSRNQTVQPAVIDLNVVVGDLVEMLRRLIDENIQLTIVPFVDIGLIKADAGYVGQVLMNLVVNARDAMPNGGKLRVATSNVTLDANYVQTHRRAVAGDYVMLSVTDTGSGISEEVRARLFEPFFTTKPNGKGTGLGLAICLNIVQQCSGYIEITSEVGVGTTFQVYFPRAKESLTPTEPLVQSGPLPRGTETLMVVEDEPSIRLLARSFLEDQGYEVLTATNGEDAIQVARAHQGSAINLVVTDIIMPLMDGGLMAQKLKASIADLKILFTSGYSDHACMRPEGSEEEIEFLAKPYTSDTLIRKVREILDKPIPSPAARARERLEGSDADAIGNDIRVEDAERRTDQAEARSLQADTRTAQANTRVEQANTRTEQANTRTEQANTRTEQANTRAAQADSRTEQAEARTEQTRARSAQTMRAAELRYRRLFETAQDGILILDAGTGQVMDANPFMRDLLGYSAEEFLGRKLWEIGPFKGEAASRVTFAELQRNDRLRYEALPLETKDGRRVEVEFVTNAYFREQKRFIQCNIRDLTARKHAEKAAIRLAAIVEFSEDAIIAQCLDGIVQSWNAGAEKMFGYSAAEMVGGPITPLVPAERLAEESQMLNKIKRGESMRHFQTVRQGKDGRQIDVSVTISPIKNGTGEIVGASKVLRDVSASKRVEEQIRVLTAELETFKQAVSRDVRTPLRDVVGFVELLQAGTGPSLSAENLLQLQTFSEATRRMGDLIDELLTFSRTGRADMKRRWSLARS